MRLKFKSLYEEIVADFPGLWLDLGQSDRYWSILPIPQRPGMAQFLRYLFTSKISIMDLYGNGWLLSR